MIGAIIGDIAGSRFEYDNHRSKDFELFSEKSFLTDDTIISLAVAKALMETVKQIGLSIVQTDFHTAYADLLEKMTIRYMKEIGPLYPDAGYGAFFSKWLSSEDPQPYNSYGNGAAMRISPIGYAARTLEEAEYLSAAVTRVTHSHEEGMKGAEAVAVAIFMARKGFTKPEIREKIEKVYYPLDFTIEEIRKTYQFNETCQDTVPQALQAFFESSSFEDAIRTAVSVGGDSDTLAAITGAVAEAYYGVPKGMEKRALSYLDDRLLKIYQDWQDFVGPSDYSEQYKVLTKYIKEGTEKTSSIQSESASDDAAILEEQKQRAEFFKREYADFLQQFPENQNETVAGEETDFSEERVRTDDADFVLRALSSLMETKADDPDRTILDDQRVQQCLKRLKTLDRNGHARKIKELFLTVGGFFKMEHIHLTFEQEGATLNKSNGFASNKTEHIPHGQAENLQKQLNELNLEYWKYQYINPHILDGTQWKLAIRREGDRGTIWIGNNAFPPNWQDLLDLFEGKAEENELLTYCKVSFPQSDKTFYYRTERLPVKIGDEVIVPYGPFDKERTGIVESVRSYKPSKVPLPASKTKEIIRIANK